MEKHILKQDDDGHWYTIPAKLEDEFESLNESEDYARFNKQFYQYAVGGSPSLVQFYLPEDVQKLEEEIQYLKDAFENRAQY